MSRTFIMTIVGPYSLGIVKALAHTTHEQQGNWIDSKVARLEGHFSALIKMEIADSEFEALKSSLSNEFPQLQFSYDELGEKSQAATKCLSLELDCEDRAGIIRDIHALLSDFDLHLQHMESHRYEVIEAGKTVFSATLALDVPEEMDNQALIDELGTIADDLRIHVL